MNNSREMAVTLAGAAVGAVAAFLFFTERGRSLRRQIEPALDNLSRELNSFRATVQKASGAASEGWKLLNEAVGEPGTSPRYPGRQTAPF
jgi:gas vesicle protein